jgi:copper homeostasis protein
MSEFLLEIACFSPEYALQAAQAGADRLELCDNPAEGGTTPSYGYLKRLREKLDIALFPIIRPRGGHFVFTPEEKQVMRYDIELCKSMGFDGVVIGLLNADGKVDYDETVACVELAYPMEVTFHRAFDRATDMNEALETIIHAGCTRILTSGQYPDVNNAAWAVSNLIKAAENRIIIMPGSGVTSDKVTQLAQSTGAHEFHASARRVVNKPYFIPPTMAEELAEVLVNADEVTQLKQALAAHFASVQGE